MTPGSRPRPAPPTAGRSALRRSGRCCDRRARPRSEEHTSELQSQSNLVCRLLLEKKNKRPAVYGRTLSAPRPTSTASPTWAADVHLTLAISLVCPTPSALSFCVASTPTVSLRPAL